MDYFEQIIARLIEKEGKWVKRNVKINISAGEKKQIGKPSMPRPEMDIVAYNVSSNELEIWEVKSYLDSQGVKYNDIKQEYDVIEGCYKILTTQKYIEIITERLLTDWGKIGLIKENPKVRYGLAAGKIYSNDENKIRNHFDNEGWLLRTPEDIADGIKKLEAEAYENDPFVIMAKIIFR
jgi:hypothetical protein